MRHLFDGVYVGEREVGFEPMAGGDDGQTRAGLGHIVQMNDDLYAHRGQGVVDTQLFARPDRDRRERCDGPQRIVVG